MIKKASLFILLALTICSAFAKEHRKERCGILQLDVVNATNYLVKLSSDPEYERIHGYILKRGLPVIPSQQVTHWFLKEHPLSGPEGTIRYEFTDSSQTTLHCTIHYDQTYCGLIRAGMNRSWVNGDCSIVNDHTKPSLHWNLFGESQITIHQ